MDIVFLVSATPCLFRSMRSSLEYFSETLPDERKKKFVQKIVTGDFERIHENDFFYYSPENNFCQINEDTLCCDDHVRLGEMKIFKEKLQSNEITYEQKVALQQFFANLFEFYLSQQVFLQKHKLARFENPHTQILLDFYRLLRGFGDSHALVRILPNIQEFDPLENFAQYIEFQVKNFLYEDREPTLWEYLTGKTKLERDFKKEKSHNVQFFKKQVDAFERTIQKIKAKL